MADLVANRPASARRGPFEIAIDRIWRFFCSVRAAVWEIIILTVLVLIGTLRGSDAPQWLANAIPATQGLVDRWYAWDVYKSVPFASILVILAVAIAICTINRVPGIWQSIAAPTVNTTHGFLSSADISVRGHSTTDRDSLAEDLTQRFRAKKYRVLSEERRGEVHVYADRFRYGKLGTFPFHLGLILILVGGVVGARYGFRDQKFFISEQTTEAVGRGTGLSVYLEEFTDDYNELGQAQEYRSDLVLFKDGNEVKRQSITVNHPMSFESTRFYQASFGPGVIIRVADGGGTVVFEGPVPLGTEFSARDNPDAPAGTVDVVPAGKRIIVVAPDSNPLKTPELDTMGLRSSELYVQINDLSSSGGPPGSGIVTLGSGTTIAGLSVTFVGETQWSLLQVTRNPAIPIFWVATFLLIGGMATVFYFPHRRIRAIVSANPGAGSIAMIAPMARRDWNARRSFELLATELADDLGAGWTVVRKQDPTQELSSRPAVSAS